MNRIFPEIHITPTEEKIISDCLNNPAVVKYFKGLASDVGQGLAVSLRASGQSLEDHELIRALEQGKLSLLEILLSIPVIDEIKVV